MLELNKKRVLFVDDEVEVLNSLQRQMKSELMFDTIFESDPLKVLDIIKRTPIDIIVADIVMPNLDGITLLHQIKDAFPNVMRIMLTAHGDYETSMRAINEADIFGFITKPWTKDYLIGHIRMASKVHDNLIENTKSKFNLDKPQIIVTELDDKRGVRPMKFTPGLNEIELEQVLSRLFMSLSGFVEYSERFKHTFYSIPLNEQGLASRGFLLMLDEEDDLRFGVFIIGNSSQIEELKKFDKLLERIAEKVVTEQPFDLLELFNKFL